MAFDRQRILITFKLCFKLSMYYETFNPDENILNASSIFKSFDPDARYNT